MSTREKLMHYHNYLSLCGMNVFIHSFLIEKKSFPFLDLIVDKMAYVKYIILDELFLVRISKLFAVSSGVSRTSQNTCG